MNDATAQAIKDIVDAVTYGMDRDGRTLQLLSQGDQEKLEKALHDFAESVQRDRSVA